MAVMLLNVIVVFLTLESALVNSLYISPTLFIVSLSFNVIAVLSFFFKLFFFITNYILAIFMLFSNICSFNFL